MECVIAKKGKAINGRWHIEYVTTSHYDMTSFKPKIAQKHLDRLSLIIMI